MHPATGIVFGYAGGTHTYALRLPERERAEAIRAGATRIKHYPGVQRSFDLDDFGPEWVFCGGSGAKKRGVVPRSRVRATDDRWPAFAPRHATRLAFPPHLDSYAAALERGWSPDNIRGEVTAREERRKIATDPPHSSPV